MTPTWLEAAINGPWWRSRQPLIPIAVSDCIAEEIACAREGAAIIHFRAYDAATGFQNDYAETYARIIEGIRAKEDVIVYPTLPLTVTPAAFCGVCCGDRLA